MAIRTSRVSYTAVGTWSFRVENHHVGFSIWYNSFIPSVFNLAVAINSAGQRGWGSFGRSRSGERDDDCLIELLSLVAVNWNHDR